MKTLSRILAAVVVAALVAPALRADDEVPSINKRGDDEKAFVEKLANAIVKKAHGTVKNITVEKFEKKMPKEGRTDYYMEVGYKGGVVGTKYTAKVTVPIDTSNKEKWEVLRIDYSDNNRIPFSRKKVDEMVKDLNRK